MSYISHFFPSSQCIDCFFFSVVHLPSVFTVTTSLKGPVPSLFCARTLNWYVVSGSKPDTSIQSWPPGTAVETQSCGPKRSLFILQESGDKQEAKEDTGRRRIDGNWSSSGWSSSHSCFHMTRIKWKYDTPQTQWRSVSSKPLMKHSEAEPFDCWKHEFDLMRPCCAQKLRSIASMHDICLIIATWSTQPFACSCPHLYNIIQQQHYNFMCNNSRAGFQ